MPDVELALPGNTITAHISVPAGEGPFPAIVVLHEAFGLNGDIRRICQRLADNGYVAVAPDLVEGGRVACLAQAMKTLRSGEGPLADLAEHVVDWLAARPDVAAGRIGAIGFCMGGGFAFLLGITGKLAAVAPNYGQPPRELARLAASCPVVASYGGRDRMYARYAGEVKATLDRAAIDNDVKIYSAAGHSFMNDSEGHAFIKAIGRPLLAVGYNRDAAEDAWDRILTFFAEHI